MLAEFARVVTEAAPVWWLLENVPGVPDVHIAGYVTQRFNTFASDFGNRQKRNRAFQFGYNDGLPLMVTGRQVTATAACRKRMERRRSASHRRPRHSGKHPHIQPGTVTESSL